MIQALRTAGPWGRRYLVEALAVNEVEFDRCDDMSFLSSPAHAVRWSCDLLRQLRYVEKNGLKEVTLDETVTRKVRYGKQELVVPLIFRSAVPAKPSVTVSINGRTPEGYGQKYNVTARVPSPPPRAVRAIASHQPQFDGLEVWWVPADFEKIEPVPADPILVGVIDVSSKIRPNKLFFELARWVDETVESGYWAGEAY
jgi:hypothetical protein